MLTAGIQMVFHFLKIGLQIIIFKCFQSDQQISPKNHTNTKTNVNTSWYILLCDLHFSGMFGSFVGKLEKNEKL